MTPEENKKQEDIYEVKKLALAYAFEEVKRTNGNLTSTAEEIFRWLTKNLNQNQ